MITKIGPKREKQQTGLQNSNCSRKTPSTINENTRYRQKTQAYHIFQIRDIFNMYNKLPKPFQVSSTLGGAGEMTQ